MSASGFRLVDADYARDLSLLRAVREPVFVQEQRVPLDLEWDELDPLSHHVLAVDNNDQPVGTGRLTPEPRIGRMAVLSAWRGRGVGAAILDQLLKRAHALGYQRVEIHAQVDAMAFYQRFGFQVWGEEFEEAGIRHRHMRCDLAGQGTP